MRPDEISALAAVAQAVLAFATLAGTIAVAVIVYISTKKFAAFQLYREIRDGWNALDMVALSSNEMLRVADDLLPPPSPRGASTEEIRRKWFAYLVVNVCGARYIAAHRKLIPGPAEAIESCTYTLRHILCDDTVYQITQESGYEKEFRDFCCGIRQNLETEKALRSTMNRDS